MPVQAETIVLDVLAEDPGSPAPGELWNSSPNGWGPKATQALAGFMRKEDKLKLDNMSANGSGDDWVSGLAISAKTPNDQTVAYTAGTYLVNGELYEIASGGDYDLENGYGSVNHYAALAAGQRAIVLLYVDVDEVMKSVAGTPTSDPDPALPTFPADSVFLSFVMIRKHTNGNPKNITPSDITDCRYSRKPKLDELSKVSANDTTSGFLSSKLVAGSNVTLSVLNPGENETYEIAASQEEGVSQKCITVDIVYNTMRWFETNASSYVLAADLIFRGTAVMGTPTAVKVLGWGTNGSPSAVLGARLYDATNSNVICENLNINNTDKQIVSLGSMSNWPSGEAILEIHVYRVSGSSSSRAVISGVQIQF